MKKSSALSSTEKPILFHTNGQLVEEEERQKEKSKEGKGGEGREGEGRKEV